VLGGAVLDEVKARLNEKVRTSWDGTSFTNRNPDIPRTAPYPDSLLPRMESLRQRIASILLPPGTENLDEVRAELRARSQRFYDAPNAIVIYCDDPSYTVMASVGSVSQTICLAALAFGLGTCIMGGAVMWPEVYRDLLGIPREKPIVTSIAIGYPDAEAPINTFRREREPLEALAEWHGL
jgi:nitroreductase